MKKAKVVREEIASLAPLLIRRYLNITQPLKKLKPVSTAGSF